MSWYYLKCVKKTYFRYIGLVGTIACIVLFVVNPSWPTPDKLLVFFAFLFMSFGQAKALLRHLVPFVALLLVYESFRGMIPSLNSRVNYTWMPEMDILLFNGLPTEWLQKLLWSGSVRWFDIGLYAVYMLHFILPLSLAIIVWKMREKYYWEFVASYIILSFAAFFTFLLFPAAPPWLAAERGVIPPITRISSSVWAVAGIKDFPSVYNAISPNPVAAVPSLHAAYATLLAMFIYRLFGKRWGLLAWLYPILIYFGTVYQGEHYVIDEIVGAFYAVATFYVVHLLWPWLYAKSSPVLNRNIWFVKMFGADTTK